MADSEKTEKVRGKVKEVIGDVTDDRSMKSEGKADQVKSAVRRAGKDVKGAAEDVKDTLKR
jgi:uncharacterized protein YjbJ (UPF0337 family)